ncbi:hypothetical protein EYS09_18775 [Streptomyces kasugaensis]|uniref:Uncharacterized protein n=1 Tax=Streptomyces kasugaensis TaxID=1946 RepID=A0A4Q9HUL6_STRKA|nr:MULTISPECIES: hypothetical protein [Streptomyces]MYU51555.1 hypothetical protein [Streptomyces sp. SID7805]TBO58179.1 hypothetical protein EYS09_18775 [Streptomyces kasugaensis]
MESDAEALTDDAVSGETRDLFAERAGCDPRELPIPYKHFRVRPPRVQTWREENELPGRELMRDGVWAH